MRKLLILGLLVSAVAAHAQNTGAGKSFDDKANALAEESAKKEREKRELRAPELKDSDREEFEKREKIVVSATGVSDYERFRQRKQFQIQTKRLKLIEDLDAILKQK